MAMPVELAELGAQIIGKTFEEARRLCSDMNKRGFHFNVRPISVDGILSGGALNFDPYRINVIVENNVIVKLDFLG